MSKNPEARVYDIQIGIVSTIVIILYIYLSWRDTPNISAIEFISGVIKLFLLYWNRIPVSIWLLFIDISLFLLAFLISLFFFSQFALPVNNLYNRIMAYLYLLYFSIGSHGPRIKIDNGVIPKMYHRNKSHKPGVFILDTASAGLIRDDKNDVIRYVGPGLVFSKRDEYLISTIDLHRQTWPVPPFGPRSEAENPFSSLNSEHENVIEYEARQRRRFETSGLTNDGIEIVPNIYTVSSLIYNKGTDVIDISSNQIGIKEWINRRRMYQSKTGFRFNPDSVSYAISGHGEKAIFPWYQISALLAVELWREYLIKFTFKKLFTKLAEFNGLTGIEVIVGKVKEHLTQEYVLEIMPDGEHSKRLFASKEYLILKDRGIEVHEVVINNFQFDDPSKKKSISVRQNDLELQVMNNTLLEFTKIIIQGFTEQLLNLPRPRDLKEWNEQFRASLELMLRGTLYVMDNNIELHQRLLDEEAMVVAIIDLLHRQR